MFDRDQKFAFGRAEHAWKEMYAGVQRMFQASTIAPSAFAEIFQPSENAPDNEVRLTVRPFVVAVPERASHQKIELFVCVEGFIGFDKAELRNKNLRTMNFSTRVGYFRYKPNELVHVFGAHFDFDEITPGHPIFHAQMGPQLQMCESVKKAATSVAEPTNVIEGILKNVRMPSAQMDAFSVLLQICADHLIDNNSSQVVKDEFLSLTRACDFFLGAAHRFPSLTAEKAAKCYRSLHWYAR
ncbi:MAG: hypothetical protein ACOZAA_03990 [Pseudomonadota bacterium]